MIIMAEDKAKEIIKDAQKGKEVSEKVVAKAEPKKAKAPLEKKEAKAESKPVKEEKKDVKETPKADAKKEDSKEEKKEEAPKREFTPRREFQPRREFTPRDGGRRFGGRGRDDDRYQQRDVEIDLDKFRPKRKNLFPGKKVFGKWETKDVVVTDLSLAKYINLETIMTPHSFGRKTRGRFEKANLNVVERLVNKTMRSGQGKRKMSGKYIRGRNGCGKKLQSMRIVEGAFDIVQKETGENPIQVLVKAIEFSAPREDVTRVKRGGVAYSLAVDVAPLIRLDEAIKNLALAGFANSFNKKISAERALADELIAASKNDSKSASVKRRDEVERVAKASR